MNTAALLAMLQTQDSLFPIGAFTLSNGMETLVSEAVITSAAQLQEYAESYLGILPFNELGVMSLAYRKSGDFSVIRELDEYYGALRVPMEVRRGSEKLCRRFLKILEHRGDSSFTPLIAYSDSVKNGECYGHHPIAVGLYAKACGMPLKEAATIYGYNLLSALVTNTVKSVPLSQMEGQRVLYEEFPHLTAAVEGAMEVEFADIGIGGTQVEIAAMRHETLYSRLYMS